jgi:hypothetical protein
VRSRCGTVEEVRFGCGVRRRGDLGAMWRGGGGEIQVWRGVGEIRVVRRRRR